MFIRREVGLRVLYWTAMLLVCALFAGISIYRARPENIFLKDNTTQSNGDTDVSIQKVYRAATEAAKYPVRDVGHYFIYMEHSPGLFQGVAALFIHCTGASIFTLQLFGLSLQLTALLLFHALLLTLFQSRPIAFIAFLFAAFSRPFLYYATSLHMEPYVNVLLMSSLLLYLLFLRTERREYLAAFIPLYFLLFQNHWVPFLIAPLWFAGICFAQKGRISRQDLMILFSIPAASLAAFFLLFTIRQGGIGSAIHNLTSVASFRLLDRPIEGGYFEASKPGAYLNAASMGKYASTLLLRIQTWYYLSGIMLSLMLAAALYCHRQDRAQSYRVFYFWIPAAFCWQLVMFQHNIIHEFTVTYHWPLIASIFGIFCVEVFRYLREHLQGRPFRTLIASLAICPAILPVFSGATADILTRHAKYAASTAAIPGREIGKPYQLGPTNGYKSDIKDAMGNGRDFLARTTKATRGSRYLLRGPYADIPAGNYHIAFQFSAANYGNLQQDASIAIVEILNKAGMITNREVKISDIAHPQFEIAMDFVAPKGCEDWEFRIKYIPVSDLTVKSVTLTRLN